MEAMRYATQQMSECNIALRHSPDKAPNKIQLLDSDVDLAQLSAKCTDVVDELQKELSTLETPSTASRTKAYICHTR